jgi:hypothetical protein
MKPMKRNGTFSSDFNSHVEKRSTLFQAFEAVTRKPPKQEGWQGGAVKGQTRRFLAILRYRYYIVISYEIFGYDRIYA